MVLFIVVACLAQGKKYDSREGVKEKKKERQNKAQRTNGLLFPETNNPSGVCCLLLLLHLIPYSRPRASVDRLRVREGLAVVGFLLMMI